MIKAYITNLKLYDEGRPLQECFKLPITAEDFQKLLKQIGIDGIHYTEVLITKYETDSPELREHLSEFEDVEELNYLAILLNKLNDDKRNLFKIALATKFKIALATKTCADNIKGLINLAQNLNCYQFMPGITNEEELGRLYLDENFHKLLKRIGG